MLLFNLFFCVVLSAVLLNTKTLAQRCATMNPRCELSDFEAQNKYLSSYFQLRSQLHKIKKTSRIPMQVGPVIQDPKNHQGLLDIDVPLNLSLAPVVNVSICGPSNETPTIREAVVCSVTKNVVQQPPRGNTDESKIGRSNSGWPILGARLGKRGGIRLMIVTQLHGNEAASTEAVLHFLKKLTRNTAYSKPFLKKMDMLFVLRANPDGGEPSAQLNNIPILEPFRFRRGFFRQSVDPEAGGGLTAPTESDFLGVVGRGYDINRYNYVAFDNAVRPVESQTLVSALHAFRPDVLFDLHGDVQKVLCDLDPASFSITAQLPTIKCAPPELPIPTLTTEREAIVSGGFFADDPTVLDGKQFEPLKTSESLTQKVRFTRTLAATIVNNLDKFIPGHFSRFAQFVPAGLSKAFTTGTLDRASMALGGIGMGWEVVNFVPQIRPGVSFVSIVNGSIVPSLGADTTNAEPCFLRDNICIHEKILHEALNGVNMLYGQKLPGDGGYCAIPLNDGMVVDVPLTAGFPPPLATNGTVMIPQGGQFNVNIEVSGACAGDRSV